MDRAQAESFSTPLKQAHPDTRKFGSVPYINRNAPLKHRDIIRDDAKNDSKRDEENGDEETESARKKQRVARKENSAESLDSSPAPIEMMDRDAESPGNKVDDVEEILSGMISTAVKNISNSDLTEHENGNQTSLFRNLLSSAKRFSPECLSPERHPLTPVDHKHHHQDHGTGLPNLDSLTPLKSHVESSEDGVILALQTRFRQELDKYEHLLQGKHQQSEEYRKGMISYLEKIKELDERLDAQNLAFSALWSDHEVLKASQAARVAKWESRAEEFERVSSDKNKLEERVSKLKTKLSELRNEIKMLHQNSQILQEKFQVQVQDNDSLKKQLDVRFELEKKLQLRVENLQGERDQLRAEKDHQEIEVTTLKNSTAQYDLEARALKKEIENFEDEIRDKDAAYRDLQNTIDTKRQSTTELEARVTNLVSQLNWFEKALESKNDVEKALGEGENKIGALEREIKVANDQISQYREREKELEQHRQDLEEALTQSKRQLESVTDQIAIRSAELEELQHDNDELLQTKAHLEEFVKIRDAAVEEWKHKFDNKCTENNRLAVELESFQFRNGNLESEHLVELEQLHQQMTSLQESLRVSSEQITRLETKRNEVQSQLNNDIANQARHDSAHDAADAAADTAASGELRLQIEKLQQQLREKDVDTSKRLQLLAEDLYIQYSSKHEQKVKMLKKGYETKYQDKMERLNVENTSLRDELTRLNNTLKTEREDKKRLAEMLNV
ncbi:LAFA_0E17810g1_1 [Lachancea sp. 'fantastica']|nr:LAFA_0E17810g1_1 [Lachancea sp. 'fantastica']